MLRTPSPTRLTSIEDLLTPDLVARLGGVEIASRKIFSGKLKGERRSKKRGESVEFADHRPYVSGDDLRHIDWNIFGRLDRLFLKLFLEEEDLSLHIVIDCSASSDCGEPNKFAFMQRLASAIAYVGLANLNRVAISAIGEKSSLPAPLPEGGGLGVGAGLGLTSGSPSTSQPTPNPSLREGLEESIGLVSNLRDLRGKRRLADLAAYILSLEPSGGTRFTDACKRIAISRRGRGVMVLLSDFLVKEGYESGLRLLKGHGYDLFCVQVLSPDEMEPGKSSGGGGARIGGDLRLKDTEDGDRAEVTITAPLLKKYEQVLSAYINRLHEFCSQRDIVHMVARSDAKVDVFVMDYLRRRGLLR